MKTKSKIYTFSSLFLLAVLATSSASADPWRRHTTPEPWREAAKQTCNNHGYRCDEATQDYQVHWGNAFNKTRCTCIPKR